MKRRDNLGDEIKDILSDALNTKNFNRLNQDIGNTVNSALRDIESMFTGRSTHGEDILWEPLAREDSDTQSDFDSYDTYEKPSRQEREEQKKPYETKSKAMRINPKPAGRVSSVLFMVFGFLGIGLLSFTLLAYGVITTFTGINLFNGFTVGALIPLYGLSGVMAAKGIQLRHRVERFYRYCRVLENRSYCDLDELADSVGKQKKFVASDVERMIHLSMFPQGHLDEQKTCLILDDATYKQYEETQKWAKEQQQLEEAEKKEREKKNAQRQNEGADDKELRNTIEEGKSYMAQIRRANDDIKGEEVSLKLDRLESIIGKIFNHIEAHPEQITEIRKFMNYYLPTTLKLTNVYKELDLQPVMGENISSAKIEIEKTLDTINLAFENLLDNLFYHTAMDVSSDISVLETMLAQEGLTESEFAQKKKTEE